MNSGCSHRSDGKVCFVCAGRRGGSTPKSTGWKRTEEYMAGYQAGYHAGRKEKAQASKS